MQIVIRKGKTILGKTGLWGGLLLFFFIYYYYYFKSRSGFRFYCEPKELFYFEFLDLEV